nr:hypothetical protein [Rhodococcus sp. 15-1154-1]
MTGRRYICLDNIAGWIDRRADREGDMRDRGFGGQHAQYVACSLARRDDA